MFKLKELRERKGITLEALSADLNINKSTLSRLENGLREPKESQINQIADYFNVTTDYILGRSITKKPELSKRVKKEITEELENFRESLLTADGLMFDGEPASEEDVEKLLDAMQVGMEMIRLRNKEKFTPKKYKK